MKAFVVKDLVSGKYGSNEFAGWQVSASTKPKIVWNREQAERIRDDWNGYSVKMIQMYQEQIKDNAKTLSRRKHVVKQLQQIAETSTTAAVMVAQRLLHARLACSACEKCARRLATQIAKAQRTSIDAFVLEFDIP